MKQTWWLLYCLYVSSCGIPSDIFIQKLNTPKNLTWLDSDKMDDSQIVIGFSAYNPEDTFTGYNVYVLTLSVEELKKQHKAHVVNDKVDANVTKYYIVKNKVTNGYPSIQGKESLSQVRDKVEFIQFAITKAPNEEELIQGVTYFIGVSAFSSLTNQESALSQVISAKP